MIDEQRYLSQVVLYVHLNPVRAGVVEDPAAYAFSGHHEIVQSGRSALVDVDDSLLCFADTRRAARRAYLAGIRAGADTQGTGADELRPGGGVRWWELIPWREDFLEPRTAQAPRHGAGRQRPPASELAAAACDLLSVTGERLRAEVGTGPSPLIAD